MTAAADAADADAVVVVVDAAPDFFSVETNFVRFILKNICVLVDAYLREQNSDNYILTVYVTNNNWE